jgi:hypothetical protein
VGIHYLLTGIALLFYVHDVRTSQEAHLWDCTACNGDNFTSLNIYFGSTDIEDVPRGLLHK